MKKFTEGLKGTYAGKIQVKLCLKNNDYFDNASEDLAGNILNLHNTVKLSCATTSDK